jgi:hypothetical protein
MDFYLHWFLRKRQFFRRKLAQTAENSNHKLAMPPKLIFTTTKVLCGVKTLAKTPMVLKVPSSTR